MTFCNSRKYWGRRNESIWKTALADKDDQMASIDEWLRVVSNVFDEHQLDNVFIDGKTALMNDLKITVDESISVDPVMIFMLTVLLMVLKLWKVWIRMLKSH